MKREINAKRTKTGIVIFAFVTLISGWLGVLVNSVLDGKAGGGNIENGSLGELVWLVLPLTAAILLRLFYHDWKDTGLKFKLKKSWLWYIAAILIYPAVTLVLIIIGGLTGWLDLNALNIELSLSSVAPLVLQLLILKMFEELPWRGYLASKLLSLKLNDWLLYLINGLIWSSWHYAYYMVFLPDSNFSPDGSLLSRFKTCVAASIVILLWTVMYVELYRLAKSVWPCLIVHVVEDLLFVYILASWSSAIKEGKSFLFDINFGLISIVLLFGIGLLLRTIRIKKDKAQDNRYPG